MKHGFLITAYKNPDDLAGLIKILDSERSLFFIHIDKKSTLLKKTVIQELKKKPNVQIVDNPLRVSWGGFSHLRAIIKLMEIALKNDEIKYFHALSGQCFPVMPINEIFDFFEKNNEKEFIDFHELPAACWANNGGMDRMDYYHLHDILNTKSKRFEKRNRRFINFQKFLNLKRSYSNQYPKLYGGSTWWSLSKAAIEYVSYFIKHTPGFYNRFKHTFCTEEIFFQTILLNSPFANNIVNDNLRYIDWNVRNGNCPANLDEEDFHLLLTSNKLFARKFEKDKSEKLRKMLIDEFSSWLRFDSKAG
jgi:hypothetical protein